MIRPLTRTTLALVVLAVACGAPPTTSTTAETTGDELGQAPEPGSEAWLQDYAKGLEQIRSGEGQAAAAPAGPQTKVPGQAGATRQGLPPKPAGTARTEQELAAARSDLRPFDEKELEQIMAQAQEHAKLVDERTEALVEGFIDQGLTAMENGDLKGAHQQFAHAYELDPENPAARHLWASTGSLLGEDTASLAAQADSARSLIQARREQKRLLVDNQLEQGRQALAAGDPGEALQHFQDALALVRYNPEATAGEHSEADIAALVSAARYEQQQQQERREQELASRAADRQAEFDHAEANRTRLKVEGLMRSANDAFLKDDYETAVAQLDEVLRLDANNQEAADLRRIASRARYEQSSRDVRIAYREQWVKTFDDLEHDTIIPNDLLTFPDAEQWNAIEERGPKSFGETDKPRPRVDQDVIDRLDEVRIPVDFQQATLDEVVNHLGQVTGVNFLLSQSVQDEMFNMPPIDLMDRASQPVSRILRIVLEDLSIPEMTYYVKDGLVRIVLKDESRGDYVLQMYDVRDLTFTPVDHPSQDFNLLPSGADPESFREGVEDDEPLQYLSVDTLETLIRDNIAVDSWDEDPNVTISPMPGTLVVRQTPGVHQRIRELLENLRANTTTLINIETRFVEVEDSFLEDIGVDLRGLSPAQGDSLEDFGEPLAGGVGTPTNPQGIGTGIDPGAFYQGNNGDLAGRTENLFDTMLGETGVLTGGGGLSLEALFLDNANVNAVLRAVTKYQNSNIVNAPNLTLRSGHRGNIRVITNRTYVRDFEPEIAQQAVIAQPELDIVKDGIVLDVRAVASADKRFITLELRPTVASLVPDANGDPLPEALVSLGTPNANNVTIQLPELKVQRLRTTATIPDGATLMLGGLKTSVEQDFESETPFLADIPILGALFQRQGEYTSKRKLLILLTATIIAPEENEPSTSYLR